jgi:hypothetical protein
MSIVNLKVRAKLPPPKEKDEEQTKSFFKVLQSVVLC